MRKLINFFKRLVPPAIWMFFRKGYYALYDFFRTLGPYIRKRPYCGMTLYYNRGNNIIDRLKKEPIFELEMCSAIEKELKRSNGPVFMDIGVNIGLIAIYQISKNPSLKKIYAFEPGPVQRSMLELTIKNNNLSGMINLESCALGKEVGETTFYTHDPRHVAVDGFMNTGRGSGAKPIKVKVDTLDSWWKKNNKPKVDVVKIDTEGAELWIFQGGKEFLVACKPVLFMEIEPRNLKAYPYNQIDIIDFLDSMGYSLFCLDGRSVSDKDIAAMIKDGEDSFIAKPRR